MAAAAGVAPVAAPAAAEEEEPEAAPVAAGTWDVSLEAIRAAVGDLKGVEEAALRAILDNMPHMAWLKDMDGRYLAVNRQLAQTAGFTHPDEMLGKIVKLQLNRIKKRVEARYKIPFEYGEDVVKLVVSRCTESESGGRMIDAILTNTMLPDISREFLTRMMEGQAIERVSVGVADGAFSYAF